MPDAFESNHQGSRRPGSGAPPAAGGWRDSANAEPRARELRPPNESSRNAEQNVDRFGAQLRARSSRSIGAEPRSDSHSSVGWHGTQALAKGSGTDWSN